VRRAMRRVLSLGLLRPSSSKYTGTVAPEAAPEAAGDNVLSGKGDAFRGPASEGDVPVNAPTTQTEDACAEANAAAAEAPGAAANEAPAGVLAAEVDAGEADGAETDSEESDPLQDAILARAAMIAEAPAARPAEAPAEAPSEAPAEAGAVADVVGATAVTDPAEQAPAEADAASSLAEANQLPEVPASTAAPAASELTEDEEAIAELEAMARGELLVKDDEPREEVATAMIVAGAKAQARPYKPSFSGESGITTLYDFAANDANGDVIDMARYKGKVVLIINVASRCDFTAPMYAHMRALQQKYGGEADDFKILAFPCNQFLGREPKSAIEVCAFAEEQGIKVGACVHFFDKVEVKGKNAHPLWTWLKQELTDPGCWGAEVKWNFTKFVVDKEGRVARRVMHYSKVADKEIDRLLGREDDGERRPLVALSGRPATKFTLFGKKNRKMTKSDAAGESAETGSESKAN